MTRDGAARMLVLAWGLVLPALTGAQTGGEITGRGIPYADDAVAADQAGGHQRAAHLLEQARDFADKYCQPRDRAEVRPMLALQHSNVEGAEASHRSLREAIGLCDAYSLGSGPKWNYTRQLVTMLGTDADAAHTLLADAPSWLAAKPPGAPGSW